MYGVPADLPLDQYVGDECSQIGVGRFQLQFRFGRAPIISVEGKWELRDSSGSIIDQSGEPATRDAFRIHKIIDLPVTRYAIDAPRSFTLFFERNYALTIYDDSPQYESFQLGGYIV
jgi:hypothetical protein